MGQDLAGSYPAAADLFKRADEILGCAAFPDRFRRPRRRNSRRRATASRRSSCTGSRASNALQAELPDLTGHAAAGLSLGEFTAHAAAGTFDFETGLRLVAKRGALMQEACEQTSGAMAAMIGGDESAVRTLAAECDVDVANLNARARS